MKLRERFPDVLIVRRKLDARVAPDTFEIDVDGKVLYSKKIGARSVYLQMTAIEAAIRAARRKRKIRATIEIISGGMPLMISMCAQYKLSPNSSDFDFAQTIYGDIFVKADSRKTMSQPLDDE